MNYVFENAKEKHLDLIYSLYQDSSKEGHFRAGNDFGILSDNINHGIKVNIKESILNNKRYLPDYNFVHSKILILKINNENAGFVWLSDIHDLLFLSNFKGERTIKEIYIMCLDKKFRGSGNGGSMLNLLLKSLYTYEAIIVRTFKKSNIMKSMLLRREFIDYSTKNQDPEVLIKTTPDKHELITNYIKRDGKIIF